MTDLTATLSTAWAQRARIDWVWASIPLILAAVAALAPGDFGFVFDKAVAAFVGTLPFIIFAICATAYLRAASAEGIVAKAFTGNPVRMVLFAALVGGLSPFCSCEVIPFIAALLAMGVPLSAVMAFWLASPLMDPPMFAITSGAIGLDFAIAKTVFAVMVGLIGGYGVMALSSTGVFANPLRPDGLAAQRASSCCGGEPAPKVEAPACGSGCGTEAPAAYVSPFEEKPVWAFWREPARVKSFKETGLENALFLGKWLALAYVIEAMMIRWVPADMIAEFLGGGGIETIFTAAVLGAPAYLNGYAAAPLAAQLMEKGMNPGAAMSFMLAGGVTSIPAAMAVWSLVKARIFAGYLGFAVIGSVLSGLAFAAWVG